MPTLQSLPRALLLRLLYAGGGLAVATAAAGVWLAPLPPIAGVAFALVEALGLVASLAGAVLLVVLRRARREPAPRPDDWDTLAAARRRLVEYVEEAAAHSFAVPFVLVTTGILVLVVVTRVLTRSYADNLQVIVFGLGFLAMTLGGIMPYLGLQREARRLAEFARKAESEE